MTTPTRRRKAAYAASAATLAIALTGCGSDDNTGSDGDLSVDVEAAQAIIDPFVGQPSEFPVQDALDKLPPEGAEIVLIHPGTPAGNLFFDLMKPAAEMLGAELSVVDAGATAQAVSSAMDSVLETDPDAVIDIGVDPAFFSNQLDKLRANGTVVVGIGMSNGAEFGFETVMYGPAQGQAAGELMAASVLVETEGKESEFVIYTVPELGFLKDQVEGAKSAFEELCDGCDVRVVDVPAAQLGNTAPQTIVADLQAHPDTAYAIFSNDEMQAGLPAAMKVARIDVPTIGDGSLPPELESIQKGDQEAGLGTDIALVSWTAIDQVARELTGQALSGPEAEGLTSKQILRQEDLEGVDVSQGWLAYPDFQDRFKQLWGL